METSVLGSMYIVYYQYYQLESQQWIAMLISVWQPASYFIVLIKGVTWVW